MKAKKKTKSKSKGKPINAATFLAKLDSIRAQVRSDFGARDAEIPATHNIVKELALLIRVAKAETMYRDVEDEASQPVQVDGKKLLSNKQRRDAANDDLLAGLGAEGAFNPMAGPDAAPLGRTPRVKRKPNVEPATAETVADRHLLEGI